MDAARRGLGGLDYGFRLSHDAKSPTVSPMKDRAADISHSRPPGASGEYASNGGGLGDSFDRQHQRRGPQIYLVTLAGLHYRGE